MQITDKGEYDVIVAGAGSAGFCAAVQCGRLGLRTALFEEYGTPGGTMTVMGNNSIDQFNNPHRPVGDRMIIGGIGWEFCKELESRGYAQIPDMDAEYRVHWQYGVKVNPVAAAKCMDDFLLSAGVALFYHHKLVAVETHTVGDLNAVDAVIVSEKCGLCRYRAKIFIDCTGDGDLCVWAGAEYAKEESLQPGTLRLYLNAKGIDAGRLKLADKLWQKEVEKDATLRELLLCPDFAALLSGTGDNINHIGGIDSGDSDSLSRSEIEARRLLSVLTDVLVNSGAGNPIVATAPATGIRESRRIIGDVIMTGDEYLAKRVYPDAICYTYWFIDIHRSGEPAHIIYLQDENTPTIALGSLLPKKLANVLVAGRCVSADRACSSAIRVKASCMAIGQAAGAAAYCCIGSENLNVHKLAAEAVRSSLAKEGAIIPKVE